MKLTKIVVFLWLLVAGMMCMAQNVSPTCPNFTNLQAGWVTATTGTTSDPFAEIGVVNGRHTLITQQGYDPNTDNRLRLLPAGVSRVIRLGNEQVGAEAESITYRFLVDEENSILMVKFAVVLYDPHHNVLAQPRFVMRIMDAAGNLIEACSEYDVCAGAGIPGFQSAQNERVQWRDWTNVGLDMSHLAGQEVRVQFITYDCDYSGHYGYAYFTASCISNRLDLTGCEGDDFTVSAPEGFDSYLWSNGSTGISTSFTMGSEPTNIGCLITSATGCQFTLSAYVANSGSGLPQTNTTIYANICQGEPYTSNYFDLPPQHEIGTFTFYNTFFNIANCIGNVTTTLFLTVQQSYYPIEASICHGEHYTNNGFNIINPSVGVLNDTLFLTSSVGCDSIVCLTLTVFPSFAMPNEIVGEEKPCLGELYTYTIPDAEGLGTFTWQVPTGAVIYAGQNTATAHIVFTDTAQHGNIIFHGANGCGSGAIPFAVVPQPTYHITITDTLCVHNEYHNHGFDLPIHDSAGYFYYAQNYTTATGCDSVRTLILYVFDNPSVTITGDSVICAGETTTLHALGEGATISGGGTPPLVAIGDILCTDNTTVKPNAFAASGKTAKGVVFYVDATGLHGWAVALEFACNSCRWGPHSTYSEYTNSDDVSGITNYTNARQAITDINGMANTLAIKTKYGSNFSNCEAAYSCYYYNHTTGNVGSTHRGWYLPAAGQLRKLYSTIHTLNPSIALVGGTVFPTSFWLWSSSEYSYGDAWDVNNGGNVYYYGKYGDDYDYGRAVCAF